ncbi:MAG TPA: ThuA domain-containing protein [Armatimonadota bacterium]|nr:ThuA domain-containing protein [Armatimonadota bacterium]
MLRLTLLAALGGLTLFTTLASAPASAADEPWLSIPGGRGPGHGKNIVLIQGDQEYRSEETLPALARILAKRHGFNCTVLFTIDPKDGTINPTVNNIPGLEKLKDADLVILFTRFLDLPDDQMKAILEYVDSGRPIIGMRTATHAFAPTSKTYSRYAWNSKEPGFEGGFGRLVLGETWVAHHGEHAKQGTRGLFAPGQEAHPILKGIQPGSIFGPTDVYAVRLPLPGDSTPVVLGQVTESLSPDSAPVAAKNDPMMPIAWTRTYTGPSGKTARVFTTTMGAAQDFAYEGTRRMLVNAAYWALGMENQIPAKSDVALVGEFNPSPYRFRKAEEWKPGIRPSQLPK